MGEGGGEGEGGGGEGGGERGGERGGGGEDCALLFQHPPGTRFRWTPALHGRVEREVRLLGGYGAAVPTEILERMHGVTGITLRHIKSHLQKCRNDIRKRRSGSASQVAARAVAVRRRALEAQLDAALGSLCALLPSTPWLPRPSS
jgi:SHAQKYF class myb-like DNA-binding protein